MPGTHANGTLGILSQSELDRDIAGVQGTFGWSVQSGAVTFTSGLQFAVAAIAAGDYTVNSVSGSLYAGGNVTLSTQDPTNPRVDIIVTTSAGSVSAVAGTPAALTTTSGPVPPTPTTAQLEIARIFVPASGTALTSANITDRRHPLGATSTVSLSGLTQKYKSATQSFNSTTFADVTATSGNLAGAIAASEVWLYEWWITLINNGTGGAKFQITGPGTPTAVNISGFVNSLISSSTTDNLSTNAMRPPTALTTAFSTPFMAADGVSTAAGTTADAGKYQANISVVYIRCLVLNGANAGTVTLQGAQNSANSTTVLQIGSMLRAVRIA